MSRQAAVSSESVELQIETARLIIRAAAVVLSLTAVLGVLALPVTPRPGGPVALVATLIAVGVAWWQTTRPKPDAFGLILIWSTLTALAGAVVPSPVANAQTMSLFTAVFLGVFLLEGRRMLIVLGYAWVVWAWMMTRIAPGLERDLVAQIGINHVITLVIGTVLMVTLRRRMRLVIERAVARFHELPVGAFRSTEAGEIIDANSRLVSMLGYESIDDLRSVNAKDLYVDKTQRARLLEEAGGGGTVQGVHVRILTKDGRQIEARFTLSVRRDPAGNTILEGTVEDVTAVWEANRRASRAEERFTSAFDSAPIGMLMVSPEGEFMKANEALRQLLGYSCADLQASRWSDLGDGSTEWDQLLAADGESEHQIRRYDSTEIWVKVSTASVEDDSGRFCIAQLVDITPERTLQASLEAAVKAKDEFIASVSHELRTPLTAVVGFSDMLVNDQSLVGEERVAMQRLVHGQAESVSHIVEDLLVAARVSNGGLSVNARQIDLETVAGRAVADCCHSAGNKDVVKIEGAGSAWADPERVRQILRNLVTNAYRYGGEQVSIRLSNGRSCARVAVIDNGPGIEPEDVESIWQPYVRAHPDTSTTTDSIGLGLAVARQLAELMGGQLSYRHDDGLSIFELTLPATTLARAG
jgi:PAS domain S-box-containing protein